MDPVIENNQLIEGKKIVYFFRLAEKASEQEGVAIAFTSENSRSKSAKSDTTATKDGTITTPGAMEHEINATAYLSTKDQMIAELEDAIDNNKLVELWEANLAKPKTEGKFEGRYFQGYITEYTITSNAEDLAEAEMTFSVNGTGAKGDVTVSAEQQKVASYIFKDTTKESSVEV